MRRLLERDREQAGRSSRPTPPAEDDGHVIDFGRAADEDVAMADGSEAQEETAAAAEEVEGGERIEEEEEEANAPPPAAQPQRRVHPSLVVIDNIDVIR